jgi:hypothetical protein
MIDNTIESIVQKPTGETGYPVSDLFLELRKELIGQFSVNVVEDFKHK